MVKNNNFLWNIFVFYKNYLYICKDFKRLVFDIFKIRLRRGGRVVDCGALEKHWPRKGPVGSNPTPSALGKHTANFKKWIIIEISVFWFRWFKSITSWEVKVRFPFIIMKLKWVTDKIVEKYGFQPKVRT